MAHLGQCWCRQLMLDFLLIVLLTLSFTAHLMSLISMQSFELAPPPLPSNPTQSPYFLSEVWANSKVKASYLKVNTQPIRCQLNSNIGTVGGAFLGATQ
jgi:hypothetical protein